MTQAISAMLSPAVGILVSPFPIVGLILILLSKKAKSNSIFYMLGWIFGNTAVFIISMLLIGGAVGSQEDPSLVKQIILFILGGLMILLAIKQFMQRPKGNEEPKTPKWFAKMSNIKPLGAAGFGVILSAANPKNLLLGITAGVSVGALTLSADQSVLITVIYVLLASSSIWIPTLVFLLAGDHIKHVLDEMREWLVRHNAAIMSVLFLFIGLDIIGKAFG